MFSSKKDRPEVKEHPHYISPNQQVKLASKN